MTLPIFYQELLSGDATFLLNEESTRHVVQVLRMKEREKLQLTNGKGKLLTVEIISANKKACMVSSVNTADIPKPAYDITIAISPVKNNSRFEWFLEKATEIGITAILPLICERTEKQHFRHDRMNNILVSAMLQSQQPWLPVLHQPQKFPAAIAGASQQHKYIAHCLPGEKRTLLPTGHNQSAIMLIGPEGDFTKTEIDLALAQDFIPVTLGDTRLRTETAGIVAAVLMRQ